MEVKNQLVSFQKKWFDLPIRWTKKDNLHITLIFIGYADDAETAEICKIARETAADSAQFSLKLNKIYFGPPDDYGPESKKIPRMVWAQGEENQELSKLQGNLENSLFKSNRETRDPSSVLQTSAKNGREQVSAISTRRFCSHITLGRIKQFGWQQIEPEERPDINEEISLNFKVSSIEVMESQLKRGGPEYTILEKVYLKS